MKQLKYTCSDQIFLLHAYWFDWRVQKSQKYFILVILFYGNNNVCLGVCEMDFTNIVTFKRLFLVWKGVMCMFRGWGKMWGVCVCTFWKRLKFQSACVKKCAAFV